MWAEAGPWSYCFLAAGHGPFPGHKLTSVCAPEPRNVPGPESWTYGKLSRPAKVRVPCADPPRLRATSHEETIMSDVLHVVHPRAAGLDVHKMQITATVRLCPRDGGEPVMHTGVFSALGEGLERLVNWLGGYEVEAAVLEATGVYWLAPFEALEDAGITAQLVHAQHVKQLRGRKTDIADSEWLACVCQLGLARPSHVPPRTFRQVRPLTRFRRQLIADRSRVRNRTQKVIDRCGVRIGGVLTDLFGVNARRILNGLVEGLEREVILDSLDANVSAKLAALGQALAFDLDPHARWLLADLLGQYDALSVRLERLDQQIEAALAPWDESLRLLQTVPGVDRRSACAILAEVGPDLSPFARSQDLAAWAGVAPGNHESAGKRRATRTRRGSPVLRAVLTECALGAARTRDCQFQTFHRTLTARRGYKRATVATAHKLLRTLFAVLRDGKPYRDPQTDYEALLVQRNAPRWVRMLQHYGVLQTLPDGTLRVRFA